MRRKTAAAARSVTSEGGRKEGKEAKKLTL
jgi:hypothetical protein